MLFKYALDQFLIQKIDELPEQIIELSLVSQNEGFRFINRLIDEYQSGQNCFDQEGEALYSMQYANQLIAIGGINTTLNKDMGRLRRFYVHPEYRRHGMGELLLRAIEEHAKKYFNEIVLYTDTHRAAAFYKKMGYSETNIPNSNFSKRMK
ncbi:Amino-acid acetyltransferase [Acinetobacter calcoaceticus]|uniref:N-acetylglutamate synthase n=2 Tax=Acinetobacter calcoaceticus TaxID=471 RepID=A0A446ZJ27_ACICA|nr:Amino-acid acetyltransferase [Acinetobacter calcoaceticus]VAX44470.1 N-acetylglutamate synthase [Acinetobacter calcoaceticus]